VLNLKLLQDERITETYSNVENQNLSAEINNKKTLSSEDKPNIQDWNLNVSELRMFSELLKKQNVKVGDISKELYENNLLTQLLRKEISEIKDTIKTNGTAQDSKKEIALYTQEIKKLKKQLIAEKKSKIVVQEELLNMYEREERLLNSHGKLLKKYHALSNSRLGKITLAYWESLKRFKRGGK
jgi:hypothetical protein